MSFKSINRIPKLSDIAERLGKSTATVSRALNKPDLLNQKTVALVRSVAEQMGYRRNYLAFNFKRGRTQSILIIVPGLSTFFLEVIRGIEQAAKKAGYLPVIISSDGDPAIETEYLDQVACGRADGVLLVSSAASARPAQKWNVPPVVSILDADACGDFASVRIDHVEAAANATGHLIGLGHRRIAYISGNQASPISQHRQEGYLLAMERAGLGAEADVAAGDFSAEAGCSAMTELLGNSKGITGVLAVNDEVAVGALQAIRTAGLRVPEDISVIGFDNMELGRLHNPRLTTVHVPGFDLGYQGMVALSRILAGDPGGPGPAAENGIDKAGDDVAFGLVKAVLAGWLSSL